MDSRHPPDIRVEGVTFGYNGTPTLDRVSCAAAAGETTVVLGRSGVGKSTLLRILVGLERPHAGRITIADQDLATLGARELNALRRRIGFCFQSGALLNSMTVAENIAFPLCRAGGYTPAEIAARIEAVLATVELDGQGGLMPSTLSGGMRKRAGLARALALDPEILLFDEPTSGLDPILAGGIRDVVLRLKDARRTMVVVTHDLPIAFAVADHIVMLEQGRVLAFGSPLDIQASEEPRVRQFLEGRPNP